MEGIRGAYLSHHAWVLGDASVYPLCLVIFTTPPFRDTSKNEMNQRYRAGWLL
jgi:hypothetical protein